MCWCRRTFWNWIECTVRHRVTVGMTMSAMVTAAKELLQVSVCPTPRICFTGVHYLVNSATIRRWNFNPIPIVLISIPDATFSLDKSSARLILNIWTSNVEGHVNSVPPVKISILIAQHGRPMEIVRSPKRPFSWHLFAKDHVKFVYKNVLLQICI